METKPTPRFYIRPWEILERENCAGERRAFTSENGNDCPYQRLYVATRDTGSSVTEPSARRGLFWLTTAPELMIYLTADASNKIRLST